MATTIIFDRDGTLVDYADMFHRFVVDLYDQQQVAAPPREAILTIEFWERIASRELHIGDVRVQDRIDDVIRTYMTKHGTLYDGVRDVLISLKESGARMAIVSGWVGTEETFAFFEENGLTGVFETILTLDDIGEQAAGKIHSEHYLSDKLRLMEMAVERLDCQQDRFLLVGDSPEDIIAGKRFDAETVAVKTGNGSRLLSTIMELEPDWILDSAADLQSVFGKPLEPA
jgi:phosphoglycolate phosphatase-like HAD superfamily hydrolase